MDGKNSNQFYKKYLKYKAKYVELKKLLGGRNPAHYNRFYTNRIKDSDVYNELRNVISRFIEDLIVKHALSRMHTTDAERTNNLWFLNNIFDETINKYVRDIVDSLIWESTSNGSMNLIKFYTHLNNAVNNIHISLVPHYVNGNPGNIEFHITSFNGYTTAHYGTKQEVKDFFNGIDVKNLSNELVGKYLALAVYAFNFFVSGNSHDSLEQALTSLEPIDRQFITMLETKYIPHFFDLMIQRNAKKKYRDADVEEVFAQTTMEDVITAKLCVNAKLAEATRLQQADAKARQVARAEQARLEQEAQKTRVEEERVAELLQKARDAEVKSKQKAIEQERTNTIDDILDDIISMYGTYVIHGTKGINTLDNLKKLENFKELFETYEKLIIIDSGTPLPTKEKKSTLTKKAISLRGEITKPIVQNMLTPAGKKRYEKYLQL